MVDTQPAAGECSVGSVSRSDPRGDPHAEGVSPPGLRPHRQVQALHSTQRGQSS